MTKISNQTYNFLFHPLHRKHSAMTSAASVGALITLTVVSLGVFGILFAIMQWKDRKVTVKQKNVKTDNTQELFKQSVKNSNLSSAPRESLSPKLQEIKNQHAQQLDLFEKWASQGEWIEIKNAHYDWWMFPVNRNSSGYGAKYNVSKPEIEILKKDVQFMQNYLRGVVLVVKAWGWNLQRDQVIASPQKNQHWDGYGVRLAKMSDSLQLFDEKEMHQKLKKFFVDHCLPTRPQVPISDFNWLKKSFAL